MRTARYPKKLLNITTLFLLIASAVFSGCSKEVPAPDYNNANQILNNLDELNGKNIERTDKTKVNTYVVTRPKDVGTLRTAPKIMQTLFLGYVDKYDNQISDYFTDTLIDNGDWLSQKSTVIIDKKLGGINE